MDASDSEELEELKAQYKARLKRHARVHKQHPSESGGGGHDDGEGNWLVSYADMMTLLFGFFVVLSAFSTPNANKMEALKKETAKAMGAKYIEPYEDLVKSLRDTLRALNLEHEVTVTQTNEGVTIISKGTFFYDSGSADLKERAAKLMDYISTVLADKARGFKVIVEGHTDNVPIVSKNFESNWELSALRATRVVRLLEGKGFLRPDLMPIGLADTQPVLPNVDKAGNPISQNQAENRRIVIRVQRQFPKRLD